MKYSAIKNVILALVPGLIFWGYQTAQVRLMMQASISFNRLPYDLFNILAPCLVGIFAFLAIAYVYTNRNSLVFISLFCGSFLVNIIYAFYALRVFGLSPVMLERSAALQIAYLLMAAYALGFWVSLISFIRGKARRNQATAGQ